MGKGYLEIASDLTLPLDYITETGAILARRGAGKTYTALKLAEEFARNDLPFVAIDPTGVMWGLRSSASGTDTGWPITILGGGHGDLPLEPTSGKIIADFVVHSGASVILDLSMFESNAESYRFLYEFADRLYRLKAAPELRQPLHLLLDEADQYCPQQVRPDQTKMLGAWEKIVKLGRSRGLGMTMITQRPATLNKNVLTQIEVLFAMQITSPQDRKAIEAWIAGNASKEEAKEMIDSLASLRKGEGWFWSPGWLRVLQRIKISQRLTFDSSRTPEAGQVREPRRIAEVDLDELASRMSATIEKVQASDPERLKARIRELERELGSRPIETQVVTETIEVVPKHILTMATGLAEKVVDASMVLEQVSTWADELVGAIADVKGEAPAPRGAKVWIDPEDVAVRPTPKPRSVVSGSGPTDPTLGKAHKAILSVLAQYPGGRSKRQVGMLTGYSTKGGGFNNALSSMRTSGYINTGDPITITGEGLQALGDYEALPEGRELFDYWVGKLGKAEKAILIALERHWPVVISKAKLGELTGYEPGGGGFNNALSRLNTLELLIRTRDGLQAAPDFMEAIGR